MRVRKSLEIRRRSTYTYRSIYCVARTMCRFIRLVFLISLVHPVFAQTYPEYEELYVNDFAHIIQPEYEARIREMLRELREDHGIEFTVVTISEMSEYGHDGAIETFATGLFNSWGVGDATRNNGVMMLVAHLDRRIRIEVGDGYGLRKNASMKQIIDRAIVPQFKLFKYSEGIEQGTRAIIADLTGSWPSDDTLFEKIKRGFGQVASALSPIVYPSIPALGGFGFWLYRRVRRYRLRRCPIDGSKMQLLEERWDDRYLNPGERKEEELRSVDYDVWKCPRCTHRTIEGYSAWLSRYSVCDSCNFRTLESDTTILVHATENRMGRKRIDYKCMNCHESYSVEKMIPRVAEPSRSSGSSSHGSSFGGGSSSGGGASGSW